VPEVFERVTRYEVSVFPEAMHHHRMTAMDAAMWSVTVADRGHGRWAVVKGSFSEGGEVLGSDGEWDYEPRPSSREDDWLATHRFDLETALRLAREQAPRITWNGLTALDVLARRAQQGAE
jgi:hypothetical protein